MEKSVHSVLIKWKQQQQQKQNSEHGMHPWHFQGVGRGVGLAVSNCGLDEGWKWFFFSGERGEVCALGGPDLFGETDLFFKFTK